MADTNKEEDAIPQKGKILKEGEVAVPQSVLVQIQEQLANQEKEIADGKAKMAGMQESIEAGISVEDGAKLREKKNFEPTFRTVRIRKYPIAGDFENLGYIIGRTSRGAYQEVDRSGVSPQVVDYIEVVFLGEDKTKDGKIKAEKIKLLDYLNKGIQVHCKVLGESKISRKVPTGEEVDVSVYDPQHGLVSTGEQVDSYVTYSDTTLEIQIPGVDEPVKIDALYCNN